MAPLLTGGVIPTPEQVEAFQKQQMELLATLQKQQGNATSKSSPSLSLPYLLSSYTVSSLLTLSPLFSHCLLSSHTVSSLLTLSPLFSHFPLLSLITLLLHPL